MRPLISSTLFVLLLSQIATAQFNSAFLQNASYWVHDKSEFDFYEAEFMRDGQRHSCEMLMIFTPKLVDSKTLEDLSDPKAPNSVPVIQMRQLATIPRGLVMEHRSIAACWRADL